MTYSILGPEDSKVIDFSPEGIFVQHKQTVTLIAKSENLQVSGLVCWIFFWVLFASIVTSVYTLFHFLIKLKKDLKRQSRPCSGVASHINEFSTAGNTLVMLPKYVSSPTQNYSTQKLYQWCQKKEMQHYKSLWAVNPSAGKKNIELKKSN
jgi:hypothetical protein